MGKKGNINIRLSLCMIVKDEAENLPACIQSVKDLVDEMIVVDTGSKDETVKAAEESGARVFSYKWNDDFSAARNESLKYAIGEWILVLDADEVIDKANKDKIRKLIKRKGSMAYYLSFRSRIRGEGAGEYVYNAHPRLFRNNIGICYQGRIHEEIVSSVEKAGGRMELSDVEVTHYGYEEGVYTNKEKAKRNIRILLKEVQSNPDNGMTYYYLGEAYSLMQKWTDAVDCYKKGAEKENIPQMNLAVLFQNMGTALLHLKKYDDAISAEIKAVETNRYIATPHLVSAVCALEMQNYDKAIWDLNRYLEISAERDVKKNNYVIFHEPNFPFVYTLLGKAYLNTRNYEDAENSFLRAVNGSAVSDEIYYLLYKTALGKGDFAKAEEYIRRAVEIKSNGVEYYIELGNLLGGQEKFYEAEKVFQKALSLNENDVRIKKGLGAVYFNRGEFRQAADLFENINDDTGEAPEFLAECYSQLGNNGRAREIIESLIERGFKRQNYFQFLGGQYEESGDTQRAYLYYKEAVDMDGGSSEVYYMCGNKLLRMARFDDAVRAYNKSIRLTPQVKEPRMNLGVVYIKMGDFQKAAETYLNVLKIDPADRKVKRNLATVYSKLGDIKSAEKFLLESK
ncbi:tetratricopeptide repeat protein [candidate division KSB1 bacterium]